MDNDEILIEQNSEISTITLNRVDKHNAFNSEILKGMKSSFEAIDKNNKTRCLFLTHNGPNFSAGGDLNWMKSMKDYTLAENETDARLLADTLQTLNQLSKPVIAAVNGRTLGGGLGLLACCDIVIAHEEANFCFSEAKLGLIPATIAPYIVRSMGYSVARRFFITTETFDANTAQKSNLVHIVTPEDPRQIAHDLAKKIIRNGPEAIAKIKNQINQLASIDNQLVEATAKLLAEIRVGEEAQEGITAFFEKRPPKWT